MEKAVISENAIRAQIPYLKRVALSYTKNLMAADDLLQDTLFRIWCNREKFNLGTNFKAWSAIVMRNIFLNGYRKEKNRSRHISDLKYQFDLHNKQEVFNKGVSQLNYEDLLKIVNQLKENYSRPIILFEKGYSYKEIAEEMDISIGTVKSRIHTARGYLKEKLNMTEWSSSN